MGTCLPKEEISEEEENEIPENLGNLDKSEGILTFRESDCEVYRET